ncbi:monovalent cation/H+ antiporter complex subunit F [Methanocalculus chunghsingensis]|nr:monovalent cation/H+ antiporter complex subunit F [Methanocalculus chunghsingensis]
MAGTPLIEMTLTITGVILGFAAFICLYRVAKGPTLPDRIMAVNIIGTTTAVLLVIIATQIGQPYIIDIALTYAMLGFLVTLCVSRYLTTGRIFS